MTEATKEASILIATSWQALGRVKEKNERTELCNCIIVIVFAAFYIKANLNYIIDSIEKTEEVNSFFRRDKRRDNLGLQNKLGWFYNYFIAKRKARNGTELYDLGIKKKLKRKFPGFNQIYDFRNQIAHGNINRNITNIEKAEILRIQTKELVGILFSEVNKAGYRIERKITYESAIDYN